MLYGANVNEFSQRFQQALQNVELRLKSYSIDANASEVTTFTCSGYLSKEQVDILTGKIQPVLNIEPTVEVLEELPLTSEQKLERLHQLIAEGE